MQYINKNTGECAANLNYGTHPGTWEVYPHNNNRYRVLKKGDTIEAIDLNVGSGMIEVGKPLPGYNKVVESIEHVVEDNGNEFFEVTCYLKQRSYIHGMENSINKEQPNVAEVTDAYLSVQELLVETCHKYDIARDDQLKLFRAVFNLQNEKR